MRIKRNDTVLVISGKDKGKKGKVRSAQPTKGTVTVEGVNMMKRHTRPSTRNQSGGIVEREAPIHMSNVMPWCEAASAPSKILMKRLEDGSRVRVWKINGEALD